MLRLFVYGTLRTPAETPAADTHYHHRIAGSVRSRSGAVLSNASLYDFGAYPGVAPGDGSVRGEVFEVDDTALAITDVIEGHPDFYERRVESVTLDSGEDVEAWVYWAPATILGKAESIPSGDWFDRGPATERAPLEVPEDDELDEVFGRIADEECSWFSSTRADGRPHLVPMWHVVAGHRLYVATAHDSVKRRNIASNPHVAVSLVDPLDVVRIEGWAIEAPATRSLVAPLLKTKYDWDLVAEDPDHVLIEITPLRLVAWTGYGERRRWDF